MAKPPISSAHRNAIAEGQRRSWAERREQRIAIMRAPETRMKISEGVKLRYKLKHSNNDDLNAIKMRIDIRAEKWKKKPPSSFNSLNRILCTKFR